MPDVRFKIGRDPSLCERCSAPRSPARHKWQGIERTRRRETPDSHMSHLKHSEASDCKPDGWQTNAYRSTSKDMLVRQPGEKTEAAA
eukprot:9774140-Alexandrium_andersonii.AAC.1